MANSLKRALLESSIYKLIYFISNTNIIRADGVKDFWLMNVDLKNLHKTGAVGKYQNDVSIDSSTRPKNEWNYEIFHANFLNKMIKPYIK